MMTDSPAGSCCERCSADSVRSGWRDCWRANRRKPRHSGATQGPRLPGKAKHVISLFHGRRPIAGGYVRSQAGPVEVSGPASEIGGSADGASDRWPDAFAIRVQEDGQSGVEVSESTAAPCLGDRRDLRDPVDVYVQSDAHAGSSLYHTGTVLAERGPRWARGSRTDWDRERESASFVALDSGSAAAGGLGFGDTAGFCLPSIRDCLSTIAKWSRRR